MQAAFPELNESLVKDDLAYPAMLARLPSGLLGIVIASLIAAFMSTISTHLNWGGSYLAHDFYHRFLNPQASQKKAGAWSAGISTVVLILISSFLALFLESALDGFNILLQIGAGTGLIYILRWFWWRINAFTEIAGMLVSFAMALFFKFAYPGPGFVRLLPRLGGLAGVGDRSSGHDHRLGRRDVPDSSDRDDDTDRVLSQDSARWEGLGTGAETTGVEWPVNPDRRFLDQRYFCDVVRNDLGLFPALRSRLHDLRSNPFRDCLRHVAAGLSFAGLAWIWPRLKMDAQDA